jgi:hypothetical protein
MKSSTFWLTPPLVVNFTPPSRKGYLFEKQMFMLYDTNWKACNSQILSYDTNFLCRMAQNSCFVSTDLYKTKFAPRGEPTKEDSVKSSSTWLLCRTALMR